MKKKKLEWLGESGDCRNVFYVSLCSLQVVCDYLTVGSYCRAIPYSPQVPTGNSIESMIAFPQEPNKKSKIHFFLASNEQDFKYVSGVIGFLVACSSQKVLPYR